MGKSVTVAMIFVAKNPKLDERLKVGGLIEVSKDSEKEAPAFLKPIPPVVLLH